MLEIEFLEAKNHEKTVKINGLLLHSAYSPSSEALKFANNLEFDFNFNNLFLIEPGLGYSIKYLKEKFPDKKIYVIKLTNKIPLIDSFENVIYFDKFSNSLEFENFFYNNFSEIDLLASQFISFPSVEKIFTDEYCSCCNSIKTILNRSKSVLITRGYFEKKWLKNTCSNLKYLSTYVKIVSKLNCPIVIVASGTSLTPVIPLLKKFNNNIFIICVSSAITPLLKNNIIPDLCISTDGGYWAGEHLEFLIKKNINTKLAIPMEAYCQKKLLQKNIILPLSYKNGISHVIEKNTKIDFYTAERNGTVSGTALKLAQTLTDDNIYFCGLDLHNNKGFQHIKPNKLEINKIISSNKINSLQKNLIGSEFSTSNLLTYENWFSMQKTNNRVYRIIENPKNSLNEIKDIIPKDFEKILSLNTRTKNNIFSNKITINNLTKQDYLQNIYNYLNNYISDEQWIKEEFPLDYVSLIHSKTDKEKQLIIEKINKSNEKLIFTLNKILNISENK